MQYFKVVFIQLNFPKADSGVDVEKVTDVILCCLFQLKASLGFC